MTVDLDVLVRSDLIDFLVQESETRGATIVCKSPSPQYPRGGLRQFRERETNTCL